MNRLFLLAAFGALAVPLATGTAKAQALTVVPVTIAMTPGQAASTLTVINQGDSDSSFQVRVFAWSQDGGDDRLVPTDEVLVSPPLGSIPQSATQIVRLVLRQPPKGREVTYRILLDQIPPPAAPGTVRVALRLSIPIFAEPATRVAAHLQWHIEREGAEAYLVALNDGNQHETARNIVLTTPDGSTLKPEANLSPYILAGATHRWHLVTETALPAPDVPLRLTIQTDAGKLDELIHMPEKR